MDLSDLDLLEEIDLHESLPESNEHIPQFLCVVKSGSVILITSDE